MRTTTTRIIFVLGFLQCTKLFIVLQLKRKLSQTKKVKIIISFSFSYAENIDVQYASHNNYITYCIVEKQRSALLSQQDEKKKEKKGKSKRKGKRVEKIETDDRDVNFEDDTNADDNGKSSKKKKKGHKKGGRSSPCTSKVSRFFNTRSL